MEEADWEVMAAVQDELLDPVVVATAVRETYGTLTHRLYTLSEQIRALRQRECGLTNEIDWLTAAIRGGGELALAWSTG